MIGEQVAKEGNIDGSVMEVSTLIVATAKVPMEVPFRPMSEWPRLKPLKKWRP